MFSTTLSSQDHLLTIKTLTISSLKSKQKLEPFTETLNFTQSDALINSAQNALSIAAQSPINALPALPSTLSWPMKAAANSAETALRLEMKNVTTATRVKLTNAPTLVKI